MHGRTVVPSLLDHQRVQRRPRRPRSSIWRCGQPPSGGTDAGVRLCSLASLYRPWASSGTVWAYASVPRTVSAAAGPAVLSPPARSLSSLCLVLARRSWCRPSAAASVMRIRGEPADHIFPRSQVQHQRRLGLPAARASLPIPLRRPGDVAAGRECWGRVNGTPHRRARPAVDRGTLGHLAIRSSSPFRYGPRWEFGRNPAGFPLFRGRARRRARSCRRRGAFVVFASFAWAWAPAAWRRSTATAGPRGPPAWASSARPRWSFGVFCGQGRLADSPALLKTRCCSSDFTPFRDRTGRCGSSPRGCVGGAAARWAGPHRGALIGVGLLGTIGPARCFPAHPAPLGIRPIHA